MTTSLYQSWVIQKGFKIDEAVGALVENPMCSATFATACS